MATAPIPPEAPQGKGRALGRPRTLDERIRQVQAMTALLAKSTGRVFPRGVVKFTSHEAAEAWKTKAR
jgi:hypothetical protein